MLGIFSRIVTLRWLNQNMTAEALIVELRDGGLAGLGFSPPRNKAATIS